MPIGASESAADLLPKHAWEALRVAAALLIDELHDDLNLLQGDSDFGNTFAMSFLPNKYLPSYTAGFLRQFLACVTLTGWKLFDSAEHRLSCLAEELALNAIIRRAEAWLEEREFEPVEFEYLEGVAFEDMDFQMLFDPSLDGIEDTDTGRYMRIANLKFSEWFEPFNAERGDRVHPYVEPEEPPQPGKDNGDQPSVSW